MIYEVYLDGELLYYQGDEVLTIHNAVLKQALNEADTLEFDIYSDHPMYNSFAPRSSMVQVLKSGDEVFYGEVREITDNLDYSKHIYAVGELAFLFDSIQPQAKYQDITPYNLFSTMVNLHNSQVEARKQFTVGMVTVTDPNNSLYRFTNYEDTLTVIRDKLCDRLDGFLRIRKTGGTRYIDLVALQDYGTLRNQTIEFGENLLEYSCNTSAQDIATALIPLGARQEESVIEGLDAYLTIKSVNNNQDYIYNQTAVNNFGWVKVVKHWDDITLPANLLSAAQNWLTSAQYETMTLELNAVDLSALNADMDSIEVGDRIRAVAEPFGMNTVFPLQKKTTYLQEPSKNYIVLGSTMQKSYTQQASKALAELEYEMPQQNSILDAAKRNALEMLLDETQGGYVVFEYDANNESMVAINICDAKTIANSTKRWRWSQNGFGYMYRASTSASWTGPTVAMTMDGSIVANFITTGTMLADRLKGGTLELGYKSGYSDGVLIIRNSSGTEIGRWDKNGISIKSGSININDTFKVTSSGELTATSGTFSGDLSGAGGTFSGSLSAATGTFAGNLSAAGGTFSGSLSAADGTFKGTLSAARGTISDGTGTLSLSSGNLYMTNSRSDGPGLFAEKSGSDLYSCWGAKNSAARKDGSYRETNTINVIKAGENESDERLKQDIEDLDADYCKSLIFGIKPKQFSYKKHPDELELGVIAQDIAKVQEEYGITKKNWLCYKNDDDMYEVEYKQLIAPMIKVIQEQQKQIDSLREEIERRL
mgnify:CR=1 FL=1